MLDNLPAWLRHLVIVAAASFAGFELSAVLAAQGVTGVDWPQALIDGLNLTAVSTAAAAASLWGLPLTRQYGVGANDPAAWTKASA